MIHFNKNKQPKEDKVNIQENKKTLDQQFAEATGIDVSKKERGVDLEPVIGIGVTRSIGTDSYPYTVIDILKHPNGKKILKIENDANIYEHDSYTVFPSGNKYKNEKDVHYLIQKEKWAHNGKHLVYWTDIRWNEKTKRWNKGNDCYYHSVGQRHSYLDPHL